VVQLCLLAILFIYFFLYHQPIAPHLLQKHTNSRVSRFAVIFLVILLLTILKFPRRPAKPPTGQRCITNRDYFAPVLEPRGRAPHQTDRAELPGYTEGRIAVNVRQGCDHHSGL
jgi:hypothetical protein